MSFTKHQIQTPRRRSRARIFVAGLVGFVAVNAVAAIAVSSLMSSDDDEAMPATVGAAPSQEETDEARVHRLAGLDAMERQDYDVAVRELTAAARAGDDTPELLRLISLAQQMRTAAPEEEAEEEAAPREARAERPAPRPEVDEEVRRLVQRARASTRRAERPRPRPRASGGGRRGQAAARPAPEPEPDPEPEPVAELPAPTVPETPFDETRGTSPSAGSVVAALPPPAPAPTTAPSPRPVSSSATSGRRSSSASRRGSTPPPTPRATGELSVQSPNVYGDVWVNGRNFGPAPRVVRDVPVGSARVEIRVDGRARRTRTVRVREGRRETVRIY